MTGLVVAGGLMAAGIVAIVWGLMPPRVDLAVAIGRWEAGRRHVSQSARPAGPSLADRVGRWLADTIAGRGTGLPAGWQRDLAVLGLSVESQLARLAGTALIGLVIPPVLAVGAATVGLGVGVTMPAGAGIILAVILVAATIRDTQKRAQARREELRRSVGTYLDLVSMSMAAGSAVTEALPTAAAIGSGWTFELLGRTVGSARRSGQTPWQALGELGDAYGLAELTELAAAAELAGGSGATIRASLDARAQTLRRRQLADARADADAADDDMRITQIIIAFGFLVLIGYPAAAHILAI